MTPVALVFLLAVAAEPPAAVPPDVPPEPEALDPGYVRVPNPAFPQPIRPPPPPDRGPSVERAALAPYFAFGKRAGAKWAYDEGRYDKAKKLLETEGDAVPVRYLRAAIALKQSDYKTASVEFQALADLYPAMRDRCLVQSAWAYEALKNWDGAAKQYERVSKTARQYPDAMFGLSRAKRMQRDLGAARAALNDFVDRPAPPWGRDVGAEALLALADVHAARRDDKAEREVLLKLWSAHPNAPQASRAEARLPSPVPASVDQKVSRADGLIDAHKNAMGIGILEPLVATLKLPDPIACRAQLALGKGQRKLRAHAKAVEALAPVVKKCADPDVRARALFLLGFSRTIVEPGNAAATYESLGRDYPGHPQADDALFAAAEVRFKEGDQDKGMKLLSEVIERYPTGDFVAEALFKRFWVLRRANDTHGATKTLAQIFERFSAADDSYELERAAYWRARMLAEDDDAEGAVAAWAKLAQEHPTTYYGLTARDRIAEGDPAQAATLADVPRAVQAADPFPMFAGPVAKDPNFVTAVELLRLGFGELVPTEILAIDRTNLTGDSLRLMVHVLALAGNERQAHGLARIWLKRDLGQPITKDTKPLFVIAYPNAFRPEVEKAADEADQLEPNLLQAIMREESALDPKVKSWAGAIGLTQLMPPTAAEVAAKLKLPRPSHDDLTDPALNLRLGGRYLSDLLKRAKGVKHFAIAGYNAGEGAVKRWRVAMPGHAIDEWVEDIPLSETRGYVKRVLRSYNTYQLLYPPPAVAPVAPAAGRR